MSVDKKAAEYVKQFYDEPEDLLETYEAYRDGFNEGREDLSTGTKITFMMFGMIVYTLMLLLIDQLTHHGIFK